MTGALSPLSVAGLLVAGLLLSAFFSGSETGYMSVDRVRLRHQKRDGSAAGRGLVRQLRNIEDPILTCLIGTNLANVIVSAVITLQLTERFGDGAEWLAVPVAGVLVILFGEILPKVLYREFAEPLTLISSRPIAVFMFVLAPVRWALKGYSWLIRRVLPRHADDSAGGLDRRRVAALLLGHAGPENEREDRFAAVLRRFLSLATQPLWAVMRPIEQVVSVTSEATVGDCLALAAASGYSRLPVARSAGGDLTGYVLVRDLLFRPRSEHGSPIPGTLVRRLLLVDGRLSPYGLFEEMRSRETQLAVVVDPGGNPRGMITLEDLIETVFGSLRDEFDPEELDGGGSADDETAEGREPGEENA